MISIPLLDEPEILAQNSEEWGIEFEQAQANGNPLPHKYRNDEIRSSLREETRNKCAYCESFIEHISFSHIEHIAPKSVFPRLVCAWPNLTLACSKCNTNKGDYYSEQAPLLNPYVDDVEHEIVFYGPMAIDRSSKAKLTISKLKLNRPELLFKREDTLRSVLNIIELIISADGNAPLIEALREDLVKKLSVESEYSSCSRNFAEIEAPNRGIAAL